MHIYIAYNTQPNVLKDYEATKIRYICPPLPR